MGPRVLAIILGALFALSTNPAQAITITMTPSSGTATTAGEVMHVVVTLTLELGENVNAVALAADLSTNQTIFSVTNVTSLTMSGSPPAVVQVAGVGGPGPNGLDHIWVGGSHISADVSNGPDTIDFGTFDLIATGNVGTLDIVAVSDPLLFVGEPGVSGGSLGLLTPPQFQFSGTVGSFSFVPEPPTSLLLMAAAGLLLVGRRLRRRD